jgi:two-component sensor histidine kinase
MKVLIVDDNQAHRRLCRLLLSETFGAKIEFGEAATAALGLEECRTRPPDCVLLDYRLPDMTGLEFLERLQSWDSGGIPSIAVVMLTGLADEQVAVEAMRAGAQDYLVKDRITPEGLQSAVRKATQKVDLIRALETERDRLARSLEEKEILIKEIHHRVKNNLQVIASLLRMQMRRVGSEAAVAALGESQNRVESMALIHEQLYESGDSREVDLAKHAAQLVSNLSNSYGVDSRHVNFEIAIDTLPLSVDRAIPAGLILNELISNALKHAFPDGRPGPIRIEGGHCDGRTALAVRDDGVGVPENVDLDHPQSMGLEIVRILTRQLKGVHELDRKGGTTFRICFAQAGE